MSDYTLYYDSQCPICKSFVRLLQRKSSGIPIEYKALPIDSDEPEFTFIAFDNSFTGKKAIDEMSRHFPEILDHFWMLPPSYRNDAAKKVYGVAGKIRSLYRTLTGRNCGSCRKKLR